MLPEPGAKDPPHALSDDDYRRVVAGRPDTILLTPAFGLPNTRSPRAVDARAELAKYRSKRRAGAALSPEEEESYRQIELFETDEEL